MVYPSGCCSGLDSRDYRKQYPSPKVKWLSLYCPIRHNISMILETAVVNPFGGLSYLSMDCFCGELIRRTLSNGANS
jgi:hypothetical protein